MGSNSIWFIHSNLTIHCALTIHCVLIIHRDLIIHFDLITHIIVCAYVNDTPGSQQDTWFWVYSFAFWFCFLCYLLVLNLFSRGAGASTAACCCDCAHSCLPFLAWAWGFIERKAGSDRFPWLKHSSERSIMSHTCSNDSTVIVGLWYLAVWKSACHLELATLVLGFRISF